MAFPPKKNFPPAPPAPAMPAGGDNDGDEEMAAMDAVNKRNQSFRPKRRMPPARAAEVGKFVAEQRKAKKAAKK